MPNKYADTVRSWKILMHKKQQHQQAKTAYVLSFEDATGRIHLEKLENLTTPLIS